MPGKPLVDMCGIEVKSTDKHIILSLSKYINDLAEQEPAPGVVCGSFRYQSAAYQWHHGLSIARVIYLLMF